MVTKRFISPGFYRRVLLIVIRRVLINNMLPHVSSLVFSVIFVHAMENHSAESTADNSEQLWREESIHFSNQPARTREIELLVVVDQLYQESLNDFNKIRRYVNSIVKIANYFWSPLGFTVYLSNILMMNETFWPVNAASL